MGEGDLIPGAVRAARRAIFGLLAWLAQLPVGAAHQGGMTGYADIRVEAATIHYSLTLSELPAAAAGLATSAAGGLDLSPLVTALAAAVQMQADGSPCRAVGGQARPPADGQLSVNVTLRYRCPHEVRELLVRDGSFDVLGPDLHTLAKVEWPGGRDSFAFANERREARFAVTTSAATHGAGSFLLLGIEHILSGLDHLLFLAALLIRVESWTAVLKVITAFTLAHSLTLALAVFGLFVLPDRLVESAIALSVVYAALVNFRDRPEGGSRWVAAFLFGLVHGLGFSGVLRQMNLPDEGVAWLLLQFNLGVEIGQAMAAGVALSALAWLRTQSWRQQGLRTASFSILVAGLVMFADRAFL